MLDCDIISSQVVFRFTRRISIGFFTFNALQPIVPAIGDLDSFSPIGFLLIIAAIWGASSAFPFYYVILSSKEKLHDSNGDATSRKLCLALKRGIGATAMYWSVIYLSYWSGSLENGMLAGFMVLLSPFIITPFMRSALRTREM